MTQHQLLHVVLYALIGSAGIFALETYVPATNGAKRLLQGIVLFATIATVGHVAGIFGG